VLPLIAESGLAVAAKDISQGGVIGTAMMLAECSRVGVAIDVVHVPRPEGVALARWLQTFPSYGYLLAVEPGKVSAVLARFRARGIAAADVGQITSDSRVTIGDGMTTETVWDFAREPLMGCARDEVFA
jgi:uncharacterized protein